MTRLKFIKYTRNVYHAKLYKSKLLNINLFTFNYLYK